MCLTILGHYALKGYVLSNCTSLRLHVILFLVSFFITFTQRHRILKYSDTSNALYKVMKTMCPPSYHRKDFLATHAIRHMMYMSYHKVIVVIYWEVTYMYYIDMLHTYILHTHSTFLFCISYICFT